MAMDPPAEEHDAKAYASDIAELDRLIVADQVAGVRRSLSISIPVNFVLSLATVAVAVRHGQVLSGVGWFLAVTAVNVLRAAQGWARWPGGADSTADAARAQLNWAAALACLSGFVWSGTVLLSTGPGSTDAAFHLIVGAGITGGAIALGFAYAPIAICFVTPILVVNAITLHQTTTVEHSFLAGTVAVYLAALIRSALQSQASFRSTTRLKHEATSLARSLHEAHAASVAIAATMTHRAEHDSLTELMNRAGFLGVLEEMANGSSSRICLMLLDLDGFKSINDAFGHKTGDLVLVEVAARIRASVPAGGTASRLGGDEFALVFDPCRVDVSPTELAERLIEAIGAPFGPFDAGRIGISIGIYEGPTSDPGDLLVFADEALYAAKQSGRNRHYVFDTALRLRREMRRDSERDLPAAIEVEALEVVYQPIFGDGGQRLAGVEALLRWQHPKHGWISPVEIVPAAALAGCSERLFGYILDRSLDMAKRMSDLGHAVAVAINVSPREMSQLAIDSLVLDRLKSAGLPSSSIEIEITEEIAIDILAVQAKLAALSAAGIRIAIDDFGVGYSSLATLRQMHADRIKIDRCFVTGLSASPENRLLLQAVVSLGRAMNLDVVAEGVETPDDVLTLRALGCHLMQGYHLGRPMPADALLATLMPAAVESAVTAA